MEFISDGTRSRERQSFTDWIERHVIATADFAEFRRSLALAGAERPPQAIDG